tara:strand:- start:10854 stop:11231 length:378 start_codon:yes stop_codon:yes gene_type:complete
MNFTQGRQEESMPHQTKPNAKDKIKEGQAQISNVAAKAAARPEVQAGIRAGKEGLNKAKKGLLSLIGMGDESPQQLQQPPQTYSGMGGKRRRKSRRKKRTKRRRKSRRKKRRTKRRRKSRRKRRR